MLDLTSYTYSFEELIRGKFLYVDKTEYTGVNSCMWIRQSIFGI